MNTFLKFRLKSSIQSAVVSSFLVAATVAVSVVGPATAWADDDHHGLKAVPFEFVGKADDCSPGWPAGSRIVTAAWLKGMGLPDNVLAADATNTTCTVSPALCTLPTDLVSNPNKNDPHYGLLLSKNGPTADCSAAGATIKGVKGMTVGSGFELGFDGRIGGHCGGGAPRFNVSWKNGSTDGFSFVGNCGLATITPAPQNPFEWARFRFNVTSTTANQSFPPIPVGSKIVSIDIIFDEGTDNPTPGSGDAGGQGLGVVDNIDINGVLITNKSGNGEGHHEGKDDDD